MWIHHQEVPDIDPAEDLLDAEHWAVVAETDAAAEEGRNDTAEAVHVTAAFLHTFAEEHNIHVAAAVAVHVHASLVVAGCQAA